MSASGAAAWIAEDYADQTSGTDPLSYEVRATTTARHTRLLDRGTQVAPRLLRLVGHRVQWQDDGTMRTATLD